MADVIERFSNLIEISKQLALDKSLPLYEDINKIYENIPNPFSVKHQKDGYEVCCRFFRWYFAALARTSITINIGDEKFLELDKHFLIFDRFCENVSRLSYLFIKQYAPVLIEHLCDAPIWFVGIAMRSLSKTARQIKPDIRKTINIKAAIIQLYNTMCNCGDFDAQHNILQFIILCSHINDFNDKSLFFDRSELQKRFSLVYKLQFDAISRYFLNTINRLTSKVFSLKCNKVYFDKREIGCPKMIMGSQDLEEFWIDFNLGSRSVSFYCDRDSLRDFPRSSDSDMRSDWEAVTIFSQYILIAEIKKTFSSNNSEVAGKLIILRLRNDKSCFTLYSSRKIARTINISIFFPVSPGLDSLVEECFPLLFGSIGQSSSGQTIPEKLLMATSSTMYHQPFSEDNQESVYVASYSEHTSTLFQVEDSSFSENEVQKLGFSSEKPDNIIANDFKEILCEKEPLDDNALVVNETLSGSLQSEVSNNVTKHLQQSIPTQLTDAEQTLVANEKSMQIQPQETEQTVTKEDNKKITVINDVLLTNTESKLLLNERNSLSEEVPTKSKNKTLRSTRNQKSVKRMLRNTPRNQLSFESKIADCGRKDRKRKLHVNDFDILVEQVTCKAKKLNEWSSSDDEPLFNKILRSKNTDKESFIAMNREIIIEASQPPSLNKTINVKIQQESVENVPVVSMENNTFDDLWNSFNFCNIKNFDLPTKNTSPCELVNNENADKPTLISVEQVNTPELRPLLHGLSEKEDEQIHITTASENTSNLLSPKNQTVVNANKPLEISDKPRVDTEKEPAISNSKPKHRSESFEKNISNRSKQSPQTTSNKDAEKPKSNTSISKNKSPRESEKQNVLKEKQSASKLTSPKEINKFSENKEKRNSSSKEKRNSSTKEKNHEPINNKSRSPNNEKKEHNKKSTEDTLKANDKQNKDKISLHKEKSSSKEKGSNKQRDENLAKMSNTREHSTSTKKSENKKNSKEQSNSSKKEPEKHISNKPKSHSLEKNIRNDKENTPAKKEISFHQKEAKIKSKESSKYPNAVPLNKSPQQSNLEQSEIITISSDERLSQVNKHRSKHLRKRQKKRLWDTSSSSSDDNFSARFKRKPLEKSSKNTRRSFYEKKSSSSKLKDKLLHEPQENNKKPVQPYSLNKSNCSKNNYSRISPLESPPARLDTKGKNEKLHKEPEFQKTINAPANKILLSPQTYGNPRDEIPTSVLHIDKPLDLSKKKQCVTESPQEDIIRTMEAAKNIEKMLSAFILSLDKLKHLFDLQLRTST